MPASRQVIVITGVPGVGKTSAAMNLAKLMKGSHVDLSAFSHDQRLITGRDEEGETSIVDLVEIRKRLRSLLSSSHGHLVIEGHFAPAVIAHDVPNFIFVLRKAPWVLKQELEERSYSMDKVRENVEAELIGVCLAEAIEAFGKDRVCEIDTTDRCVDDVAQEIFSTINGERLCSRGKVDWLDFSDPNWLLEG